jgi:hypothetical protein
MVFFQRENAGDLSDCITLLTKFVSLARTFCAVAFTEKVVNKAMRRILVSVFAGGKTFESALGGGVFASHLVPGRCDSIERLVNDPLGLGLCLCCPC